MSEVKHDYTTTPLVVQDTDDGHYQMVSAKPVAYDIASRRMTNRISRRVLGYNATVGTAEGAASFELWQET